MRSARPSTRAASTPAFSYFHSRREASAAPSDIALSLAQTTSSWPTREPIPIDARAADHLRYIRETMERAAEFTAVPGWGGVAMGFTAIGAAWIASRQASPRAWLTVWLVEAFVAVAIAASSAATKAHRGSARLLSGPGRKFLLSFTPPIIVGGLLTFALFQAGVQTELPGI